ncbi:hypothetical protein V6N12_015849 [Hibiscus sabdariffa]|uniref:Uncharacterized protein n=1 Tax=Hibiscus sabdariffa TaxID=183260 RepID=A0ABR2DQC2_9ROSI
MKQTKQGKRATTRKAHLLSSTSSFFSWSRSLTENEKLRIWSAMDESFTEPRVEMLSDETRGGGGGGGGSGGSP